MAILQADNLPTVKAVLHSTEGHEWLPRLGLEAQGYTGHGGFMSSRS